MRQVACNATLEGMGHLNGCRYVLHDRDAKFCPEFRETLAAGGVKCLRLPARSPNLNAFAERWVRSVKEECLSHLILFGERCAAGPAGGAAWSRRIFQPPVGDTRREWYQVWRDAQPAPVFCVLNACRFPPGWPAHHRRAASLAADAPSKCGSRVRLNGAGHQWGKDPPKEVVG